jgi:hypothetical protein
MATTVLTKQPGETRLLNMDFSHKMTTGELILSVDSVTGTLAGAANADLTFSALTTNVQAAQFLVAGGLVPDRTDINYQDYKVTVVVTTDYGQILEEDGTLRVQED